MSAIEAHKKGKAFISLMARGGELFGENGQASVEPATSDIVVLP
jgi:hypothetical protein